MIEVLFIIHYSVFSLQFSVYHTNEIYRKSFGTSDKRVGTIPYDKRYIIIDKGAHRYDERLVNMITVKIAAA